MKNIKSPDSIEEVSKVSNESLRFCLLTPDGKGKKIKEACLKELEFRSYLKGCNESNFDNEESISML